MPLAVPSRLTVLFRLPVDRRADPKRSAAQSRRIDPCAIGNHLRRDIGLQDLPCVSSPADLLRHR